MTTLLVVDDEARLRRTLRLVLRGHGFEVIEAATAAQALQQLAEQTPDLVVLDLGLPDRHGLEVLREIRRVSEVPVIILTAHDEQSQKLAAFADHADDYVTKPFDPLELSARARAALRRVPPQAKPPSTIRTSGLEIDLTQRQVRLEGKPIRLTKTELALLETFVTHPGKLLTHDFLLKRVWGPSYEGGSQYTRVYVAQLRKKLGDDASSPRLILTEPGIGYRWVAEEG